MSYTAKDIENATQYANHRLLLRNIKTMYEKYPNITSHLKYTIKRADEEIDYYFPESFKHKAIVVNTEIPKKLCDKISCNSTKQWGICEPTDEAFYYRIGDKDDFERVCQPACYNLVDRTVYNEDNGEEKIQMPRLAYNQRYGCVIQPPSLAWFEQPFYRSQERYEKRLNDLPVGFNLGPKDPFSYSGKRYEYNKIYCASYFDEFDAEKKTCKVEWYQQVLNAVVGESIIKMTKAGIESIKSGGKSTYPPTGLTDPPPIEDEWLVKNWKTDIDPTFVVPPLDYTFDFEENYFFDSHQIKKSKRNKRELSDQDLVDFNFPRIVDKKKAFLKRLKRKERSLSAKTRNKLTHYYNDNKKQQEVSLNDVEIKEIEYFKTKANQRLVSNKTLDADLELAFLKINNKRNGSRKRVKRSLEKSNYGNDNNKEQVMEGIDLTEIMSAILSSITDDEFWKEISIAISIDVGIDKIKSCTTKAYDKLIPKLTKSILTSSKKFASKVLSKSIFITIANTVSKVIIKSVSKVMVSLLRMIGSAATGIGIILGILAIFEVVFQILDPYGFNHKYDESILDQVMKESDNALRLSMETDVPDMTFDTLCNIMLSTEEIIDNNVKSFLDMYEYLDSLVVNSEGTRINKGEMILLGNSDAINQKASERAIARGKLYTPKDFYIYECDHVDRMTYFNETNKCVLTMVGLGLMFMIMELYLIGLIFMVIGMGINFSVYLNTTSINMKKYSKPLFEAFTSV